VTEQDWEKIWRGSMGVALPVALVSAIMDRTLITTVIGLWENLTAWRWLFFLSSAVLLVGLARNSARLRKLVESQPTEAPLDIEPSRPARPAQTGQELPSTIQSSGRL
jgi:hypothetical protein